MKRRIGKIRFSIEALCDLMHLPPGCVITDIRWDRNQLYPEFTIEGNQLDEVDEGERIPSYTLIYTGATFPIREVNVEVVKNEFL